MQLLDVERIDHPQGVPAWLVRLRHAAISVLILTATTVSATAQQELAPLWLRSGLKRGWEARDIEGTIAVLGSREDGRPATGLGAIGTVQVYRRNGAGTWAHAQSATAPDAAAGDRFGAAVSLEYPWLAVYASNDELPNQPGRGSHYLFEDDNGRFVFRQRIVAPPALPGTQENGGVVLLDGNRLVVGSRGYRAPGVPSPGNGAAIVFRNEGGTWMLDGLLSTAPLSSATNVGVSVASYGDRVAVGANFTSSPTTLNVGLVLVFRRQGPLAWVLEQRVENPVPSHNAKFGTSVALDAERLYVGAPGSPYQSASGSVFVFRDDGGAPPYILEKILTTGVTLSRFGNMIATRQGGLVVSAPSHPAQDPAHWSGGVLLYDRCVDGIWNLNDVIQIPRTLPGGGFEEEIAVSDDEVLLVHPFASYGMFSNVGDAVVLPLPPRPLTAPCVGPGEVLCVPALPGDCPCNNDPVAGSGEGCTNQTGRGARLDFLGVPTPLGDSPPRFTVTGMPPHTWAVLLSGDHVTTAWSPVHSGAGLTCLGPLYGPAQGLRAADAAGTAIWEPMTWPIVTVGSRFPFQVMYRDPTGPCSTHFNWSTAIALSITQF